MLNILQGLISVLCPLLCCPLSVSHTRTFHIWRTAPNQKIKNFYPLSINNNFQIITSNDRRGEREHRGDRSMGCDWDSLPTLYTLVFQVEVLTIAGRSPCCCQESTRRCMLLQSEIAAFDRKTSKCLPFTGCERRVSSDK